MWLLPIDLPFVFPINRPYIQALVIEAAESLNNIFPAGITNQWLRVFSSYFDLLHHYWCNHRFSRPMPCSILLLYVASADDRNEWGCRIKGTTDKTCLEKSSFRCNKIVETAYVYVVGGA